MKRILKKLSQTMPRKMRGVKDEESQTPRLFVHIPKTAGTSFRTAAETRFGATRVLRDYGPDSDATSESVKREVYATDKKSGILRAFDSDCAVLLAGHFPVQKYGRLFGLRNTVTIFRDPVEQVISHYRHAITHHGYEDSLLAFADRSGIKNLQTRFLFKLDPAMIGIVGLTESFRDSLSIINDRWNWDLKHHRRNVSDRFHKHGIEVSESERAELEDINQDDRRMYQRACRVFENSLHCYKNQIESEPRGTISIAIIGEKVEGWALNMRSEEPLTVTLKINGETTAKTDCLQPVSGLEGWDLPRKTLAGFEFEVALSAGDTLELEDADTGLVLDKKIAVHPH